MGAPDDAIGPNAPEANRTSTPPRKTLPVTVVIMAEIQWPGFASPLYIFIMCVLIYNNDNNIRVRLSYI